MKEFIWRKFVKDYENYKDPRVRDRYTRLTGTLGIIVNTVLCIAKIILGFWIHSIAVIGDGLHDMADSLASCITLIGARIARKPADRNHPYGHARAEYLASLVVSAIVLIVGYQLLQSSISRCLHPAETDFSWGMVVFMICAILFKGSQALFTIATGRRINSLPVIAAGTDNRNDVITSIIILIGMLVHHYTGLELDGYMGVIVALFILYSGVMLIRETITPLLGEPPDSDTVEEMKRIIRSHPEILGVHDLVIYNYGPGRSFASFHAEVDSRGDMVETHDAIDHIERELKNKLNITVTCHMDPVDVENPLRIRMQELITEKIKVMDAVESIHDLRIAPGKDRIRVIFDMVMVPGKEYSKEDILSRINWLIRQEVPGSEAIINFEQAFI